MYNLQTQTNFDDDDIDQSASLREAHRYLYVDAQRVESPVRVVETEFMPTG